MYEVHVCLTLQGVEVQLLNHGICRGLAQVEARRQLFHLLDVTVEEVVPRRKFLSVVPVVSFNHLLGGIEDILFDDILLISLADLRGRPDSVEGLGFILEQTEDGGRLGICLLQNLTCKTVTGPA